MITTDNLTHYEKSIFANLSEEDKKLFLDKIPQLLAKKNVAFIAHYYTPAIIQILADKTSGIVADSLKMAEFGKDSIQDTLLIAGVYFMAETAKVLSPEKKILIADKNATCSLDISCPYDEFKDFIEKNPGHEVVVYANTSAKVRTLADWVVTSSNAIDIVKHLTSQGKKIIWAPDKHLGAYIKKTTGAQMLIWEGECIVHSEFASNNLITLKASYPEAAILAHPESPSSVLDLADVIGSTTHLIKASKTMPHKRFIVATDTGIFYKMQQESPTKDFIAAPTLSEGGSCKACSKCPWMGMNTLKSIYNALSTDANIVNLDIDIIKGAQIGMQRMVNFQKNYI